MDAAIDTAIVFTPRMEELADFYAAGLGLTSPNFSPGHIGYQAGPVYLGFDQIDRDTVAESAVTLWFRVDDVDAAYAAFVQLGAASVYPPIDKPWGDRLAAVLDLDGNRIGLSQRR
jgi:predicted enzyme related to lactoylglutathione lyase